MPRTPTLPDRDVESAAQAYRLIDVEEIHESPSNPRKRFGDLEELALSIAQHGVIEPVIVRPHPVQLDGYELVAGARRLRAARVAGLLQLPALVRTLTDREVLEIQVTENLQRKDVHPLEESDAYAALMRADGAYTVEAVAARVGRSASYVYQRLRLQQLVPEAREAFDRDELTAGHAVKLARLTPADQVKALPECFYRLFGAQKDGKRIPAPIVELDRWIADHTKVDVSDAAVVQHYQPELHAQLEAEPEPAASLLQLSESSMPGHYLADKDHGLIGHGRWKEVKSLTACKHARRGVIVHGGPIRLVTVCATKGCPKHWPAPKKAAAGKKGRKLSNPPAYDWKAEEARRKKERARVEQLGPHVLAAAAATFKKETLTDALVRRVVEGLVRNFDEVEAAILTAGLRISVHDAGPALAFALEAPSFWSLDELRRYAKRAAIDLKAIEKHVDAEAKADAQIAAAADQAPKTTTRRRK